MHVVGVGLLHVHLHHPTVLVAAQVQDERFVRVDGCALEWSAQHLCAGAVNDAVPLHHSLLQVDDDVQSLVEARVVGGDADLRGPPGVGRDASDDEKFLGLLSTHGGTGEGEDSWQPRVVEAGT